MVYDEGERVLLGELARQAPAEIPTLHARASRWYAGQGLLDEAIHHPKAAGDQSEVGRLVWSASGHCIGHGDRDRLAFSLADLSDAQIAQDRCLCLTAAWVALQCGRRDEMDRWILRAQHHAGEHWQARAHADPCTADLAVIVALVSRDVLRRTEALCTAALEGLSHPDGRQATRIGCAPRTIAALTIGALKVGAAGCGR